MGKEVDHSGEVHDRLTLLYKGEPYIVPSTGKKMARYYCSCSCGKYTKDNPKLILYANIAKGITKSCGCYSSEESSNRLKKYNKSLIHRNTYDLSGEYGIGYTSNGEEFYFDLEDYEKIKDYMWFINGGYVVAKDNGERIRLHNLISNVKGIDHFNRNKLDCRKSNLKIVTHQENMLNKGMYSNNTSGVKGVSWDKSKNKWCSNITANKKRYNLGCFDNFEDAVKARKEAEKKYFGKHSYDNNVIGVD